MLEAAILIGLAGWRLASLLVTEDGPFRIFTRIRELALPIGVVDIRPGFFEALFTCMWCMTVWTTAFMGLVWLFVPDAVILVAATSIAIFPELISGHSRHSD